MRANELQIGGEHYKSRAIQPWDYIAANQMGYLEGCVVKYVSRFKEKNGLEDLHKALHYLTKLIEIETAKSTPPSMTLTAEVAPKSPLIPRWGFKKDGTPKKSPGRPAKKGK